MYIMLGLIFNIKRCGASFFVLVPIRFSVMVETPFFCRLMVSIIKIARDQAPAIAAYSLEIIKATG